MRHEVVCSEIAQQSVPLRSKWRDAILHRSAHPASPAPILLAILLLLGITLCTSLDEAHAGVLLRRVTVQVKTPRARVMRAKSTTDVMKRVEPSMEVEQNAEDKRRKKIEQRHKKWERKYARWQQKKERAEKKAAEERKKRLEDEAKRRKEIQERLQKKQKAAPGSASGSLSSGSEGPRAGSINLEGESRSGQERGRPSIWQILRNALFGRKK